MTAVEKWKSIKVSERHVRELRLLKEAWRKHSIDEVMEELIAPRRVEQAAVLMDLEESDAPSI